MAEPTTEVRNTPIKPQPSRYSTLLRFTTLASVIVFSSDVVWQPIVYFFFFKLKSAFAVFPASTVTSLVTVLNFSCHALTL